MISNNRKQVFSSANLFFICTFLVFVFGYFLFIFKKIVQINPVATYISLIITIPALLFTLYLKFPLFVTIKNSEERNLLYCERIYVTKVGFWSKLYIGMFCWNRVNDFISLFGKETLELYDDGKERSMEINSGKVKFINKFFDVVFAGIFCVVMFFISREFAKLEIVFGVVFSVLVILFLFRKIILDYIFSINVGEYEGYKLNILYPYNSSNCKTLGLAYVIKKTILLNKKAFYGENELKQYILAHELGHLKTISRTKKIINTFIVTTCSFITIFMGVSWSNITGKKDDYTIWFLIVAYIMFVYLYRKNMKKKEQINEINADIFAIKKIGKNAVLKGLEIIENIEAKDATFSGLSIEKKIKFIKEYKEE